MLRNADLLGKMVRHATARAVDPLDDGDGAQENMIANFRKAERER
jgi:hypothetical protein